MFSSSIESQKKTVGRKATINREDIINAAIRLTGPHRSISSLSLREITREANIAPNSFYRHFKETDELVIEVIELAGSTLRKVIGEARVKANDLNKGIVRASVEIFFEQLDKDVFYLPILLREGVVGSDRFKQAVRDQLDFFEQELTVDIQRLADKDGVNPAAPNIIARAITRLVFAMGAEAMDKPKEDHDKIIEEVIMIIKMMIVGANNTADVLKQ